MLIACRDQTAVAPSRRQGRADTSVLVTAQHRCRIERSRRLSTQISTKMQIFALAFRCIQGHRDRRALSWSEGFKMELFFPPQCTTSSSWLHSVSDAGETTSLQMTRFKIIKKSKRKKKNHTTSIPSSHVNMLPYLNSHWSQTAVYRATKPHVSTDSADNGSVSLLSVIKFWFWLSSKCCTCRVERHQNTNCSEVWCWNSECALLWMEKKKCRDLI